MTIVANRRTGSTRGRTRKQIATELLANTYMRTRPPLWMRKNRRVFALTRRLCVLTLKGKR